MNKLLFLPLTAAIALSPLAAIAGSIYQPAAYQCRRVFFGTGASNERISVDDCSIQRASQTSVDFQYYLDSERIFAQAKCVGQRHWYTFDDRINPNGQPVYPNSRAATRMINYVCSQAGL